MDDEYSLFSKYIDEKDFQKRKTNLYAKINGEYYMKARRRIPEELLRIDGIFRFYFCRVRKIGDHSFKEEALSRNYIVAEEIMTGKDFLKISPSFDTKSKKNNEDIEYYKDLTICLNSYTDADGNVHRYASPVFINETIISKPKTLKLIN